MNPGAEIELFGGPEQLFGCRHLPPDGQARAVVVVCSSGPADAGLDVEREARLGRSLARAGVVAQRFHYRGTGESDGDPAGLGFDRLVDDARRALALVRDRCPGAPVGVVGVRLGALVAARVCRGEPGVPLAMWQPAVDPRAVVERAVRAGRSAGAARPGAAAGAPPAGTGPAHDPAGAGTAMPSGPTARAVRPGAAGVPRAVWAGAASAAAPSVPDAGLTGAGVPGMVVPGTSVPGGAVPGGVVGGGVSAAGVTVGGVPGEVLPGVGMLGTALGADLADATRVGDLLDELGGQARPLLVAQTGPGTDLGPELRDLVVRATARGLAVEAACLPCDAEHAGWLVPAAPADRLVAHTTAWLLAHLAGGPSQAVIPAPAPGDAGSATTPGGPDGAGSEARGDRGRVTP